MDARPKLHSRIVHIERDAKHIYINPNLPRWIVTDALGSLIMELFNGRNTVSDIVDIAVSGIGEAQRKRVEAFCGKVVDSGVLAEADIKPKRHKYQLSSVHLSLSEGCNLKCVYCYASKREERSFPALTYQDYVRIIDDVLSINGGITFTLTGGEPLLNSDCFRIA